MAQENTGLEYLDNSITVISIMAYFNFVGFEAFKEKLDLIAVRLAEVVVLCVCGFCFCSLDSQRAKG